MYKTHAIALGFALLCAGQAAAQDAPYMDDRSSPEALVKSFYNAINRKEYARAWSYYGDQKPAASLQKFEEGFAKTTKVVLRVGDASSEGAAGSIYYNIPVAIEAYEGDGSKVFGGCYTARMANPGVQGENYQPMHLEKGALKAGDSLAAALPEKCGDAPPDKRSALEQAQAAFAATDAQRCFRADQSTGLPDEQPQSDVIRYRYASDEATAPEREATLVGFACSAGAYNMAYVYYLLDDQGLRKLQFPSPTFDVKYENAEAEDSKVEAITLTGFKS
ncbi:DUF1176 domain-containing protein, partial [Salmonella enterica subsp. enterica]|nr:DUF1176 domain-containing protein [Salmonella enterica subsp. enterica serovar Enteritidis]